MGICQGQYCYYKLAEIEAQTTNKSHEQLIQELKTALNKRWKIEPQADEILKRQIKISKYMYLLGGNI